MSQYVMLIRLTPEGAKAHVDHLARVAEEMQKAMEILGGTMNIVITLGAYDIVASGNVPTDEKLAWFAARVASSGNVSVQTMKGFTIEEWARSPEGVPPEAKEIRVFK